MSYNIQHSDKKKVIGVTYKDNYIDFGEYLRYFCHCVAIFQVSTLREISLVNTLAVSSSPDPPNFTNHNGCFFHIVVKLFPHLEGNPTFVYGFDKGSTLGAFPLQSLSSLRSYVTVLIMFFSRTSVKVRKAYIILIIS